METQYVEQKGELLLEYKGKTTTLTVRDFTPAGARIEINEQGEMKGRYNANHLETVTVLIRPDGTSEWEAKGIETTRDGDTIFLTSKGTARTEDPSTVRYEGNVSFQTPSQKLSWLNSTKGRIEGKYNNANGESIGSIYAKK